MIKSSYLSNSDVHQFIEWLASELVNNHLIHSYTKSNGKILKFKGLTEAFTQYDWRFNITDPNGKNHQGRSFSDSSGCLATLASNLNASLSSNPIIDLSVCKWACAVMKWGGRNKRQY